MQSSAAGASPAAMKRQIGLVGAVYMGLGAIVGSGVFVSIGIAAEAAGPAVLLAIALAALVAACNGLSSASLAARHPQSGGTYEYGYHWLNPTLGFIAGWTFLCAKSASAATAALGFAGYFLGLAGGDAELSRPLAVLAVVAIVSLTMLGAKRSSIVNIVIVSITLSALVMFVLFGVSTAVRRGSDHLTPFFAPADEGSPLAGLFEATALMFVAYTGYGRVATLGEEIVDPRRNIPRAIVITLAIALMVYLAVGLTAVSAIGAERLGATQGARAAPLEVAARAFPARFLPQVVAAGAVTAMLGVLLNLVLGLSRVLLAMARRGDMPSVFARLRQGDGSPTAAIAGVGVAIVGLACLGDVKATWSFSAFSVLIYYAITNLTALQLKKDERLTPRWVAWLGLLSCLLLAFWVTPMAWASGLGLIGAGLAIRLIARKSI